jgi:hypothetical protein
MPGVLITPEGGEIHDENGEVVGDGPEWLLLLSSHYDVQTEDPLQMHWVGLVENIGPEVVCSASLNPVFYDSEGVELLGFFGGSVYAPLYARDGMKHPVMCVQPGELAMATAFDFSNQAPIDVARVAEVGYSVAGQSLANLARKDWSSVNDVHLDGRSVSGTFVNGDEELSTWAISVFGKLGGEAPVGLQFVQEDDIFSTVPPQAVVSFETPPFSAAITSFEVFYTVQLP